MARRKPAGEYTTDFSWASSYIEERKTGKLCRIQVKFPLDTDRRYAGNIDYANELNRRTWRGKVPTIGRPNDKKSIRGAYSLDDAEFIFVNSAPNINNIPEGYIATISGIEPLIDPPFTEGIQQGYATNPPIEIGKDFSNEASSVVYYIGVNINTEYMRKERYPFRHFVQNPAYKDLKISWRLSPDFENPTEPSTRYPGQGAYRIRKKNTI